MLEEMLLNYYLRLAAEMRAILSDTLAVMPSHCWARYLLLSGRQGRVLDAMGIRYHWNLEEWEFNTVEQRIYGYLATGHPVWQRGLHGEVVLAYPFPFLQRGVLPTTG